MSWVSILVTETPLNSPELLHRHQIVFFIFRVREIDQGFNTIYLFILKKKKLAKSYSPEHPYTQTSCCMDSRLYSFFHSKGDRHRAEQNIYLYIENNLATFSRMPEKSCQVK